MKTATLIALSFFAGVLVTIFGFSLFNQSPAGNAVTTPAVATNQTPAGNRQFRVEEEDDDNRSAQNQPATNQPAVTKTPAASQPTATPTPGAKSVLNKVEVAKHNSLSDCYLIVSGKVYNVSSYINQHPGGRQNITNNCGQEVSGIFAASHSNFAWDLLARYYLGPLVP
ncbi:MAG: cytochrome b5 domain-containing protein [Patescibacteria group bacterium]|jgi:cytochrome b involved in lipid metabolism